MRDLYLSRLVEAVVYENRPSTTLCQACIRESRTSYNDELWRIALDQNDDLEPLLFARVPHRDSTIGEGESFQPHDYHYLMV
jgi:hypothetical protein